MRRVVPAATVVFYLLTPAQAFAYLGIWCQMNDGLITCKGAYSTASVQDAENQAQNACAQLPNASCKKIPNVGNKSCFSLFQSESDTHHYGYAFENAKDETQQEAKAVCDTSIPAADCKVRATICVPTASPSLYDSFDLNKLLNGILFGIGLLLVGLVYTLRSPIINYAIHGNLPYKLPVYGEDIQCLFKRTQRVNWYGRVIFGVVANLAMTHQQLIDVRKYWLGRVIAFDSLRRQRQNQLARMHLQLAASMKSEAKDKKPLSQVWAALKWFLLAIFYLIRAFFSFLFGFLFIRVTIARLVRGTIIESKDLVLILQAKEAIEQSTTYLKEYLTTANTFDDRDEIYEPK